MMAAGTLVAEVMIAVALVDEAKAVLAVKVVMRATSSVEVEVRRWCCPVAEIRW